jgi:serine/threonine protein kinase
VFVPQGLVYILGTIRWMAPELCTPPPEPSSYPSDVWSYGCIILEISSAREPWIDQFNDDSLLFRALQRKENAPIFARLCANQSGPSYLRQLL